MPSFRLRRQSNDESVAAPKFNIVTIDEPLGLLDCFRVIGANQRQGTYEMPLATDRREIACLTDGPFDYPTGKSPCAACLDLSALSSPVRKNILIFRSANQRYIRSRPVPPEGRWPTSLTRGRMRWTQGALKTRAFSCGRAKSCGPDTPTLVSSSR